MNTLNLAKTFSLLTLIGCYSLFSAQPLRAASAPTAISGSGISRVPATAATGAIPDEGLQTKDINELVFKAVTALKSCTDSVGAEKLHIGEVKNTTSENIDKTIFVDALKRELNLKAPAAAEGSVLGSPELRAKISSVVNEKAGVRRAFYSFNLSVWKDEKEACGSKSTMIHTTKK